MALHRVVKTLVWGGVATAIVGPALVIGAGVSVAGGTGTFTAGALQDMIPAFMNSFQEYEPGQAGLLEQRQGGEKQLQIDPNTGLPRVP